MKQEKLSLEYAICWPDVELNPATGWMKHAMRQIAVPRKHNDRLEEIVTEYLRHVRELTICDSQNIFEPIVNIEAKILQPQALDFNLLQAPPFRDHLHWQEHLGKTLKDDFYKKAINYRFMKFDNGKYDYYVWKSF